MRCRRIDLPSVHPLRTRQFLQRRWRDNETLSGVIDSGDVDRSGRLAVRVRQLPARATRGGVISFDGTRRTDVGKRGKRAEGLVSFGDHPVLAVGTRNGVQRGCRVVIDSIILDKDGTRCRQNDQKRDDGRNELHSDVFFEK